MDLENGRREVTTKMTTSSTIIEKIRNSLNLETVVMQLYKSGYITDNTKNALDRYFCFDDDCSILESVRNATAENAEYTEDVQSFVVALAFYSTKAYQLLTECWPNGLPDIETVRKWQLRYDGMPGLSLSGMSAVKRMKAESQENGIELLFSLQMRAMTVRAMLVYDKTSHTVTGHEDFGHIGRRPFRERHEEQNWASEALILLLNCVNADFVMPIAYFMVSSLDGQQKANVVHEAINFAERNGIRIISLTIDGWPHEQSIDMCTQLGAHLTKLQTHFRSLNGNRIYIIFETSCMVTLLRNILAYKGIIHDIDSRPIQWDLVKKIQKHQFLRGLRCYCNLTTEHINFSKDPHNVTLAAETMNRSVAAAILALANHPTYCGRVSNAEATASYLTTIHDLSDMLLAKNEIRAWNDPDGGHQSHHAMFEAMDVAMRYIQTCTMKTNARIQATSSGLEQGHNVSVLGLQVNIQSLRNMFDELVLERKQLRAIQPHKFSNQHLEAFIACMKRKSGDDFDDCVTSQKFINAYRRLLLSKCDHKTVKDEFGRRVIEMNGVFDSADHSHTDAE